MAPAPEGNARTQIRIGIAATDGKTCRMVFRPLEGCAGPNGTRKPGRPSDERSLLDDREIGDVLDRLRRRRTGDRPGILPDLLQQRPGVLQLLQAEAEPDPQEPSPGLDVAGGGVGSLPDGL